jgi:basic membrane protein A and related proteins
MQRRISRLSAVGAAATFALILSACAAAPDAGDDAEAPASDFLPCAVSDLTGFDDRDFNQLTYEGVEAAADEVGAEVRAAESASEDQYAGNIGTLVDEGCDLIVTVGFALANATRDAAQNNPAVNFALIDSEVTNDDFSPLALDNVKPVLFDTAQAAALAGYVAAGATKTGVVGTYGGMPFPSVTVFMDGFQIGIEHYNDVHGTDVQLLGWDREAQNGVFVGSFDDQLQAKNITLGLLDQDVDIIMPVAGTLFTASVDAIQEQGTETAIIGVNSDVYLSAPDYGSYMLTSVMKNLTTAARTVTLDAHAGDFAADPYVGTLENDGVGIAPFHEWESQLDPDLIAEIEQLKADIISGDFVVESPSSPRG